MSASTAPAYALDTIEAHVGREVGVSDWLAVDQESITLFGQVSHDPDPNHIDPAWARRHSPFGQTVAFGFQTLSLLTFLGKSAGVVPKGVGEEVNYGLDRVRFAEPVPAGARVRARVSLKTVQRRPDGVLATFAVTVEIERRDKPALVADWIVLFRPAREETRRE